MRIDAHNHTWYSNLRLRDALPTPEKLIDRAIEIGLAGVAITDHDALSAHPKANMKALEIKEQFPDFKVILGNEIYLVDERPCKNHYHFILLAKDAIGHRQLREISSVAWLNSYSANGMTRVDTLKDDLVKVINKNKGHLIAATACIGGELGKTILKRVEAEKIGDIETATAFKQQINDFLNWCISVFGDDFYLEVQPGTSKEQIIVNKEIKNISEAKGIKVIPTSDTHYLKKEDRYAHKSYLNSEDKEREVDEFYSDTYLHTDEEMIEKFSKSDFSESYTKELFKNSLEIYDKVENYSLMHTQQVPEVPVPFMKKNIPPIEVQGPKYEVLASMFLSDNDIERYWVNTCYYKLVKLGKCNSDYLDALEEEAEVKKIVGERLNTNMFSYPIALAHYIQLIWDCGSAVGAGRGSACSALNHYLLGITQLDPLEQDFPFFRYMNRDTDGLGDIDIDVSPSKVQTIISKIREERGKNFDESIDDKLVRESLGAAYVCTFGTETTKSAILTACRGYRSEEFPEGIDNDTAQYLSSLIPQERGFIWSISDVVYGNPEKGRKPVKAFLHELESYPGLLSIIESIEGCISRRSRHASGVLFMGKDPFEFNAFMKTPKGEIVTQYDLHDAEACGSVKMDILVTSVQDKIVKTIEFMQEDGVIEKDLTIKQAYDKYLHPDVLPLSHKETWKTIQNAASLDLFQLDSPIGRQGAKKVKPNNMSELSATNGLIRLMTAEKGQETYLDKYVRFKNNPGQQMKEYLKYSLSAKEIDVLTNYVGSTYGIGISQEQLMRALMDENICGFTLKEANKARKIVSKKKMNEIPEFKKKVIATAKSPSLARYVWDYIVAPGLGYSFSDIHSVSYSYIGFQTAYLATNWNPVYWNTACLAVNSGSLEIQEDEDGKKSTDYGTMAKAIGSIMSNNIEVSLVNINESSYGFKPDSKNNRILFGLRGMNGVGPDIVNKIIANRPYKGIKDLMNKCGFSKTVMFSLIKGGAFDEVDHEWASKICPENPRMAIMIYYILETCGKKERVTLQNLSSLIKYGLIPDELDRERGVFNFNKSLKKSCKSGDVYLLDDRHLYFFNLAFPEETIEFSDGYGIISQKEWDKLYKKEMEKIKSWINENYQYVLDSLNESIFREMWNKYACGNVSSWEMDSLCFYYHEHELSKVNVDKYGISDFNMMPSTPEVERFMKRRTRNIPIYKLHKIIGTVIDKDNTRSSISLLTTSGVVTVKFTKEYFAMYNRQISEVQEDGKKKVIDKSWMTRGTKIMVTGYRRDDTFVAKRYAATPTHQLYKITAIEENGEIKLEHNRANMQDEE